MISDLCQTCGIGFYLHLGADAKCDHCDSPRQLKHKNMSSYTQKDVGYNFSSTNCSICGQDHTALQDRVNCNTKNPGALLGIGGAPTRATTLPTTGSERKTFPVASGVLDYFPDAIAAIANVSYRGNEQHNAGKPLHWDRTKSGDEADTMLRHFLQRGSNDVDGVRHSAKMAWRALALLQKELEQEKAKEKNTTTPPIPDGYEYVGYRIPNAGEEYLSNRDGGIPWTLFIRHMGEGDGLPRHVVKKSETALDRMERMVAEQRRRESTAFAMADSMTVTIEGAICKFPRPEGYRFLGFWSIRKGDTFLSIFGTGPLIAEQTPFVKCPRVIVEKI